MKKKPALLIVILVLLALAAGWLVYKNKKSTFNSDDKNFAVKDTAAITKIFLADKAGNTSVLERSEKGGWTVNKKFNTRNDAVETLIKTIYRVDIKAPVAKAALNTVIKTMAASSTKVEIYSGDDIIKTYYVGGADMSGTGTYMLMEGSETPFVTFLPGFEGYLSPRFISNEKEWRSRKIFNIPANEIETIQVKFIQKPEASFEIRYKDKKASLMPLGQSNSIAFDTATVMDYLITFSQITFDSFVNELSPKSLDSLKKVSPFHDILMKEQNGKAHHIKTFPVKAKEGSTDRNGNPLPYNMDYMYGLIDNEEWVYLQFYNFDGILRPINYFKVGTDVLLKTK